MAVIETRALTFRYLGPGGGILALDDLTVDIEPGIVGLVGANGAGKSTLMRILLGLLSPTSGSATVLGFDVTREGPRIRREVGYLPEHDVLPPDVSAAELVTHLAELSGLPRSAARERTSEVLRHVGLFEERLRPIGGYSAGMCQRVKLAQALVHDPRLLLLDEPTIGLDPAGREEMLNLVRRTGTEFGMAVLVCSHLLGEIERVCDHVVAIDAGRLLRHAPVASFTGRTGTLLVELDEGAAEVAADLVAAGIEASAAGPRRVLVTSPAAGRFDAIRDAVVARGRALTRLESARHRMEEMFRDTAVNANGDAAAGSVDDAA
jgi:ABC-2 type transport system ATP-binding protein